MTASAKGSKKEKKEEPSDERVRVVVRIRPPIRKDEMYGEGSEALQVDKERNLLFLLQKEGQGVTEKTKQFVFDRVLWKDSEQVRVGSGVGVGVGVRVRGGLGLSAGGPHPDTRSARGWL